MNLFRCLRGRESGATSRRRAALKENSLRLKENREDFHQKNDERTENAKKVKDPSTQIENTSLLIHMRMRKSKEKNVKTSNLSVNINSIQWNTNTFHLA